VSVSHGTGPGLTILQIFDVSKHWWAMRAIERGFKVLYLDSGAPAAAAIDAAAAMAAAATAMAASAATAPDVVVASSPKRLTRPSFSSSAHSSPLLKHCLPLGPCLPVLFPHPTADNMVLGNPLRYFDPAWDVQGLADNRGRKQYPTGG
jgi:hypothetical protein